MPSSGQRWHRLEFTAVSRKKTNGVVGYGFVLFEGDTGNLVATGCGPVAPWVSYNQACHTALLLGLQVAVAHGATDVLLQCDSNPALKALGSSSAAVSSDHFTSALAAACAILQQQLTSWHTERVDRWANGLAVIQAEFASELYNVLQKVTAAPPSRYVAVAGQLGLLLQVPVSTRRWLEAADDFVAAAAELVAVRCGSSKEDVMALMTNNNDMTTAFTSISSSSSTDPAAAAAVGRERQICFHMQRIFTPRDGAAYAAAAAKAEAEAKANKAALKALAAESGDAASDLKIFRDDDHDYDLDQTGGDRTPAARRRSSSSSSSSSRLEMGRVVGRHRMSHRLLVVGLHPLPPGWPAQSLQQQQLQHAEHDGANSSSNSTVSNDDALPATQQQQVIQQDILSSSSSSSGSGRQVHPSVPPAAATNTTVTSPTAAHTSTHSAQPSHTSSEQQQQQQQQQQQPPYPDVLMGAELISYWLGRHRAGGAAAVGLGSARYQLPQVNSDTATHLLQFDGASRNNPGRGGYGYVIFDLTTGQVIARGCMTLPYGQTAGRAEFEGLVAGLQAALDAGVRQLAVQGDSGLVLDAMIYRRGTASRHIAVPYQKACQLLAQFEHVDFQVVPRHQNSLADRLANISMDIDTAMYAMLRRGVGDKDALRMLVKAAKINKKQEVLDLLLETFEFPVLMCVLLQRVMSLTPEQLLQRLEAKAAHMGDTNPTLVQEVRTLVSSGIPADVMQHIGAAIMDSRYSRTDMAKLRKEAALVRQKHPNLKGIVQHHHQQQQQQQMMVGGLRHYSQSAAAPTPAAEASSQQWLHCLQILPRQGSSSSSSADMYSRSSSMSFTNHEHLHHQTLWSAPLLSCNLAGRLMPWLRYLR